MINTRAWAGLVFVLGLVFASPVRAVTQQEADALFASQDWDGAAAAYDELLRGDPDNASNWNNLALSRHRDGDLRRARRAYLNALARNHPTPGRVRLNLARALMTLGRRDEALREIQQLVGTGIGSVVLLNTPEFAQIANAPEFLAVVARQTPCTTPEYRQFDFWLGEWDIIPAGATAPTGGQNSITATEGGCIVLEQYTTTGGFTGTSINFYDASRRVWHQTWMSNQGGSLYMEGGINADGAMEMSDRGLPSSIAANGVINRTIWTPLPGGGVRQHWEVSNDNGASWSTLFDGRYIRR